MEELEQDILALEKKYPIKFNKVIFTDWLIENTLTWGNFKQTIWVNKEKLAQWEFESMPINDINAKQFQI